jgi:hypothetical protein
MPTKQIANAGQAWSAGASWLIDTDNQLTQTVAHLLNATGLQLFEGDIVAISADGTSAVLPSAALTNGIGCVGGEIGSNINANAAGGFQPLQTGPARTDTATVTNASATVTDASVKASDLGRFISSPSNRFPAGTFIISVTAGVSFVASVAATGADTAVTIFDEPSAIGPGWMSTTQFPIPTGAEVPVVIGGWCKVNVSGQAAAVAGDLFTPTSGAVTSTRIAAGAAVAANIGTGLGVYLQAYAARDLSLTNIGLTGHEPVGGLIKPF